jgi:hypothetical protein
MSEYENGQLPPAKRTVRSRISPDMGRGQNRLCQGIGLCEIARNMGIPEGTVLDEPRRLVAQTNPQGTGKARGCALATPEAVSASQCSNAENGT